MTRIAVGGTSPAGLRWPNHVNGRLLTATDLVAGRDAVLVRDRWLGLAIGTGVATGLEVTGSPGSSALHVSPGTGVSPDGTAVHLDVPATLDLEVVSSSAPVTGSLFAACEPTATATSAPTAGAYLLVLRPTSSFDGQVPVAGSPTATLPTPCTSRWEVEDVTFAAIRLDAFTVATTPTNRRNRLAHFCFGSDHLGALAMSGFEDPVPWRGLEGLADLAPCDLALAVFDWTGSSLAFVDRWSARRRPARPAATVGLAAVVGDDRTAEGEARFLQFQDHLAALLVPLSRHQVRAADSFPQLPPAGLVPIDPLSATTRLLAGADLTEPPVEAAPAARRKKLLHEVLGARGGRGEPDLGRLGAVSSQLRELQQQVDALRAEVDRLAARGQGGGDATASTRARARSLAADLVAILVDLPGEGVDLDTFFAGAAVRLGVVGPETVDFTIRRSWYDEPIDVSDGGVVNVLFVRSDDGKLVAPYVLFTRRQRGVTWIDVDPPKVVHR